MFLPFSVSPLRTVMSFIQPLSKCPALLILMFSLMFTAVPSRADESEYEQVARNFLTYLRTDKTIVSGRIIEQNRLAPASPITVAYQADLTGGGYLLIAASRQLTPIKAYSLTGDFDTLPAPVRQFLLSELEAGIRALAAVRTPQSTTPSVNEQRWDFLLTLDQVRVPLSYDPPAILLTTRWEQGYPYNKYLPEISGEHVLAGCVNIALAQLMNYYGHPENGHGVVSYKWERENEESRFLKSICDHPYHWDNMPDTLEGFVPEYQTDETARLICDLAVANHTDFGIDASSTYVHISTLIENFGFSSDIRKLNNSENPNLFMPTLISEINALRPVLLELLVDQSGHLAVADGYNEDINLGTSIHINMGWGGHADDFYYLDETVDTDGISALNIIYNLEPCSQPLCFVNLEAADGMEATTLSGVFDYNVDTDRYEVNLKGSTTFSGINGFFLSVYDTNSVLQNSFYQSQSLEDNLQFAPGRYILKVSLYDDFNSFFDYDPNDAAYSITFSTEVLTQTELTDIETDLDKPPVINNDFHSLVLGKTDDAPHRILIDARDENGDAVQLSVSSSNPWAVQAWIEADILCLTPIAGAAGTAADITVTAAANGKRIQKSFVVMVSDQAVSLGDEFEIQGTFDDQADVNTHKVILEGPCTITGYNGYANQTFYTSVTDSSGTIAVPPVNGPIDQTFQQGVYTVSVSMMENPGGGGPYYDYATYNHWYRITVQCPETTLDTDGVAALLGIDSSNPVVLEHAIRILQVLTRTDIPTGSLPVTDITGDGKIGMEEAIVILRRLAQL